MGSSHDTPGFSDGSTADDNKSKGDKGCPLPSCKTNVRDDLVGAGGIIGR
jgi:hypothetical protein